MYFKPLTYSSHVMVILALAGVKARYLHPSTRKNKQDLLDDFNDPASTLQAILIPKEAVHTDLSKSCYRTILFDFPSTTTQLIKAVGQLSTHSQTKRVNITAFLRRQSYQENVAADSLGGLVDELMMRSSLGSLGPGTAVIQRIVAFEILRHIFNMPYSLWSLHRIRNSSFEAKDDEIIDIAIFSSKVAHSFLPLFQNPTRTNKCWARFQGHLPVLTSITDADVVGVYRTRALQHIDFTLEQFVAALPKPNVATTNYAIPISNHPTPNSSFNPNSNGSFQSSTVPTSSNDPSYVTDILSNTQYTDDDVPNNMNSSMDSTNYTHSALNQCKSNPVDDSFTMLQSSPDCLSSLLGDNEVSAEFIENSLDIRYAHDGSSQTNEGETDTQAVLESSSQPQIDLADSATPSDYEETLKIMQEAMAESDDDLFSGDSDIDLSSNSGRTDNANANDEDNDQNQLLYEVEQDQLSSEISEEDPDSDPDPDQNHLVSEVVTEIQPPHHRAMVNFGGQTERLNQHTHNVSSSATSRLYMHGFNTSGQQNSLVGETHIRQSPSTSTPSQGKRTLDLDHYSGTGRDT